MSTAPGVRVHPDASLLARAVAARLVTSLVDTQSAKDRAHVVLTGGGIGTAVLAEVRAAPARDAVDWSRLDVWWGDERFLPHGHPDRNETRARQALLDAVAVPPEGLHPMPAADRPATDGPDGTDPEESAARYAAALEAAARSENHPGQARVPSFDLLLLGIGPDGHVASLFPGHPSLYDERPVLAIRHSPKPPPVRITLGYAAINAAKQVWVLASGAEKADAVRLALSGAGRTRIPAAAVAGRDQTLWLLDEAAAAKLPLYFRSPVSECH